jgi:hypothetical protein
MTTTQTEGSTTQPKSPVKASTTKPKGQEKVTAKKVAATEERQSMSTVRGGNRQIELVEKNPHRKGSKAHGKYARVAALRPEARTIAKALEAKVDRGYIRWAEEHGILKLAKIAS